MFGPNLEALLPHLRAFARSLCGDVTLADDLVQDTCLKAWDAQDTYDPQKGELKPWLFRILRNEYYMRQRRSWRSVQTEASMIEASLVSECGLEASADLSRMMKAIFSLNDDQRDAFILIVAAGFTYDEAGEVCGCAAGTIKSRVSRARELVLAWYNSNAQIPCRAQGRSNGAGCSAPIDLVFQHIESIKCQERAA